MKFLWELMKSMLWRLVSDFDFWALFGGKMGVAATLAPKDLGPKNPTKKLAHVGFLLGHMLFQHHAPEISDPGRPRSLNGQLTDS